MKYFRRYLNYKRSINRKNGKCHQHKMNIISFLKSNYKYKRRSTWCRAKSEQRQHTHLPNLEQTQMHKLPADEKITSEDKQNSKKIPFYENVKLDKFLRMFILILQQATSSSKNKSVVDNTRATRFAAKLKAIYKINKETLADVVTGKNEKYDTVANYRAYKDANKDTDINSIAGKIIHQQHIYDKVSTITSTPIKCQRRNHHQKKMTNSSSSLSLQSTTVSMKTTTTLTRCTFLTTPSIEKYKTCQWTAILRHYVYDNPSVPQHQYYHKTKHIQHISSLTTKRAFNINNCPSGRSSLPGTSMNMLQSVHQFVKATCNRSYSLSYLLLTLFIAFTIGIRSTAAGACWQTVLENGKCNEIYSLNISKSECCGANQEFAYTDREPTNVEYFFATAIGGGMECSPCLESCTNVKCGLNKKCVKRKGRPKCICAPECGAARRKRKQRESFMQQQQQAQHHTSHLIDNKNDGGYFRNVPSSNVFKIKLEKSQQSRDTRSLSSEITNVNLGLENDKDVIISSDTTSPVERHRCKECNQNQRKSKHPHIHNAHENDQPNQYHHHSSHKNQEQKDDRRLLITANVEHTEKPTTRRLQIFSNVRTTQARRQNNIVKYDHHQNPLPSDNIEENNENYNSNDAEDNPKEAKKKITNIDSSNSSNKNNRNDDPKKFLNQSPSRRKLRTNNKQNSYNNNKNRNKTRHDLKTTKIRQHSLNNNTRVINPQQNGRHAENTPHHRHHNHNHHQYHHQHQQQQDHQNNSHRQQSQNQNNGHKRNNQKEQHKEQTIAIKKPKNNKDYNITTISANINGNSNTKIAVVNTESTKNTAKGNNLSNSNANVTAIAASSYPLHHAGKSTTQTLLNLSVQSTAIAATYNASPPNTQTPKLLLLSSTTSSFSSATPLNSSMSANDGAAADDHNHSRLQNHGSEIATSSLLSITSSSSYSQMSAASARSSSESSVITTMSAEGEGVSLHDHNHRTEMPTNSTYNNNKNSNDDAETSALQTNLHKNQQQLQQEQLQQTQPQLQHHYQTPLFDGISEQFDLIGFEKHKQQQRLTNEDNVRPLNPVCGTDARTYNTECQLRKRACRTNNPNLQIAYIGHCRTTCNGVQCLNGLTCVEDQYSMPHCIKCKIECPQDDYDNDGVDATRAVCGADGKTYKSTCDINRMICKIGRSISVAYPGPCREDEVTCDYINCGPKQVCLIDLLTHKPRCTSCRYKCSRKRRPSSPHFDEGKICGFNNRTYHSWCEMRKDSCSTGFYIDVKYSGDCH